MSAAAENFENTLRALDEFCYPLLSKSSPLPFLENFFHPPPGLFENLYPPFQKGGGVRNMRPPSRLYVRSSLILFERLQHSWFVLSRNYILRDGKLFYSVERSDFVTIFFI